MQAQEQGAVEAQSVDLREFQLVELALFKKFAAFAEEHGIEYFALGGTLLGAVRHRGFIPWDDDMDIGIPRGDYDRFVALCEGGDPPFELHTFGNDLAYQRYFARLEDPSVHVLRADMEPPELTSAWIDVFPLDGMPAPGPAQTAQRWRVLYRRALFRFATPAKQNILSEGRPWYERLLVRVNRALPLHKVLSFERQWERLDRCLRRYPYVESPYLVNAMGHWKFREMFPKEVYGAGADYPFEDTLIHGPADYDAVCRSLYGDYMTPVNTNHHRSAPVDWAAAEVDARTEETERPDAQ